MAEKTEKTEATAEKEKMVKIRLPKDRTTNEDEIVWVNSRRFIIQRGVDVEVPECVAEVLKCRDRALDEMYAYEDKVRN